MDRHSHIDLRQNIFLTADNIVDIVAMTTFTDYGILSQRMLGNLAQHRKLRSPSANQIGINQAQLTAYQLIADHVIGDGKCMEKRNTVDRRSILNIKLIEDQ